MFELIGCPMHLGVSALGLKKSIDCLNECYSDLKIKKIDEIIVPEQNLPNLKNLNSVVETCKKIAAVSLSIIGRGNIPLFIGGDHAAAIGTVSGAAIAQNNLGLLWVDSHSDINTHETTASGNIHGMPVSALMGYGCQSLTSIGSVEQKIAPQNIVMLGVRDIDPPEQEIIDKFNIKCITYDEVLKRGLSECLKEAHTYLSGIKKLHLSFDLDSMNPEVIKGVSVPVADGFTKSDVHNIIDFTLKNFDMSSIDIVEFNPEFDSDGVTAEFTNELIHRIIDSDVLK